MESNFLKALQTLESIQPEEALAQSFQFFRSIADLNAEDCVAAYQALDFFESSMHEKLQQAQKLQMRKIRDAVVARMQVVWNNCNPELKSRLQISFQSVLRGDDLAAFGAVVAAWSEWLKQALKED
jgi:hypothetical protein